MGHFIITDAVEDSILFQKVRGFRSSTHYVTTERLISQHPSLPPPNNRDEEFVLLYFCVTTNGLTVHRFRLLI